MKIKTLCFSLIFFVASSFTLDEIKYHLRGKGTGLDYRELFDKAMAQENSSFFGYHGDSLDFLVYQDIIRVVIEEKNKVTIRKDFHYLSVPFRKTLSMEDLAREFVKDRFYSKVLEEHTFPLNRALYDNHNRLGLNSVVNFSKNLSDISRKNRRELREWFEALGLDLSLIERLYEAASHHFAGVASGVLLQFFDTSNTPLEFVNRSGYGAYPNGFIADGDPQEFRLLLNEEGVLNPNSPLVIKRYTKLQPSRLKAWEEELRYLIKEELCRNGS